MVGFGFGIYCVPQRDRAVPAKEIVQYWCDLRILTASCQMYLHPRKIRSILWRLMSFILHIKLIKTYTTHDLNQKAEKGVPQLPDSSPNVPRTLCRPYLMGQHKVGQHSLANINEVYQKLLSSCCLHLKAARNTHFDALGTYIPMKTWPGSCNNLANSCWRTHEHWRCRILIPVTCITLWAFKFKVYAIHIPSRNIKLLIFSAQQFCLTAADSWTRHCLICSWAVWELVWTSGCSRTQHWTCRIEVIILNHHNLWA